MKKIVLLAFALIASVVTFAQVPMATLDHNDTITVFYSDMALKRAYEAAVDGDIITLSEGTFDGAFYCRKNNLTFLGAGMFYDSVAGTAPTILTGILTVNDGASGCVFEGLYCYDLRFSGASNCRINRCRANNLNDWTGAIAEGHVFNSCVLHRVNLQTPMRNCYFYNCIIACNNNGDCRALDGRNSFQEGDQNRLINCYVQLTNCDQVDNEAELYNCILYSKGGNSTSNLASHNCIGISLNPYSNYIFWDTTSSTNIANGLINSTFSEVFVNFDGTYHPGVDNLELTPAAQAILGYDGTQIGIYGGPHPFNPHLNTHTPIIGHVTVPHSSNAQGRLDVDVEVITQP